MDELKQELQRDSKTLDWIIRGVIIACLVVISTLISLGYQSITKSQENMQSMMSKNDELIFNKLDTMNDRLCLRLAKVEDRVTGLEFLIRLSYPDRIKLFQQMPGVKLNGEGVKK